MSVGEPPSRSPAPSAAQVRILETVTRLTASRERNRQSVDDRRARATRSRRGMRHLTRHERGTGCAEGVSMPTSTKRKAATKSTAKKAAKKDLVARRNEYAAKFFPYIEKVARRLARRLPAHVEIDDLISSGVIGLMEAAERFDPSRVERFDAFAESRIRRAMLDDLRSRDTLSRHAPALQRA